MNISIVLQKHKIYDNLKILSLFSYDLMKCRQEICRICFLLQFSIVIPLSK